jgi:hypothetical protein
LQQLKIIPKDKNQIHINLEDSPPPSPKVKTERRSVDIQDERAERTSMSVRDQ